MKAELYLKYFHSDRMHMFRDGRWNAEPPKYTCIQPATGSNLDNYRLMTAPQQDAIVAVADMEGKAFGKVLNVFQLRSLLKPE